MANFEIPLSGSPETFSISLNGTTYALTLQFRDNSEGGWTLDIADADRVMIVAGIPLITGANLLEQYGHLGIAGGAALYMANTAGGDAVPTYANLGTDTHLVLVTP